MWWSKPAHTSDEMAEASAAVAWRTCKFMGRTFDTSGELKGAKRPLRRPLDGMVGLPLEGSLHWLDKMRPVCRGG